MEKTEETGKEISGEDTKFIEQIPVEEKDLTVRSKNSKKTGKRDVSSGESMTCDSKAHKRSKTEIGEMSGQVNLPFTEQDSMKPDLLVEAKARENELDNSFSTEINPESSIIQESSSQNTTVQVLGYLDDKRMSTIVETTKSNTDSSQNENTPDKVSDSEGSKGKVAFPDDDILAIPGSSRSDENKPRENVKNTCRLIDQTVNEMNKTSLCFACERKIDKHFKKDEEFQYKCCQCKYKGNNENLLLGHITKTHLSEPFFCNICKVRFANEGSHESEHPCNACSKIFQCITQLEDHYYSHEKDHLNICRVCQTEIDKHCIKHEKKIYKCCKCDSDREYQEIKYFRLHLYTHSGLRIFKCDCCEERYDCRSKLTSHSKIHPKCKICNKMFVDRNSLDAHSIQEH